MTAVMETLHRKYANYHQMVQTHIAADPARAYRINVLIELLHNSDKAKLLFINHNRGGGIDKHIQELSDSLAAKAHVLVLKPRSGERVVLTLGSKPATDSLGFELPNEYETLLDLCRYIGIKRVHFHHVMGLNSMIRRIAADLKVPYDITLHDYYFVNANPTLTAPSGHFCENPKTRDRHCAKAYPIPGGLTTEQWRMSQGRLLRGADRIVAPSGYTAAMFENYFSGIEVIAAYHPDWERDAPYPVPIARAPAAGEKMKVLVIGALSKEKGADLLESCAKMARRLRLRFEFHLIGYAYRPLDPAVITHGAYYDTNLERMISDLAPHLMWFPALWPETYSYTLSAAFRCALPVVAPDLGAFSERCHNRPYTWIVPFDRTPHFFLQLFARVRRVLGKAKTQNARWRYQMSPSKEMFSYRENYLNGLESAAEVLDDSPISLDWVKRHLVTPVKDFDGLRRLSRRERLLISLIKLRENPLALGLLNYVPYRMQKNIKRSLSNRPIHDIVLRS